MKGREEDRMMRYRYVQTSENLYQNEALKLSRSDSSFSHTFCCKSVKKTLLLIKITTST